jgi:hypothetical protein
MFRFECFLAVFGPLRASTYSIVAMRRSLVTVCCSSLTRLSFGSLSHLTAKVLEMNGQLVNLELSAASNSELREK